jgi:hypothetical protein
MPASDRQGDVLRGGASTDASSPEAVRAQIEETRAELAETVDAIQEKLDPEALKERAQQGALNVPNVAAGKVGSRLEHVEHLMAEAASAAGEKIAGLTQAASARTQHFAEQARNRADETIHAASAMVHGGSAASAPDATPGTSRTDAGQPGIMQRMSAVGALYAGTVAPTTRALIRRMRTYPVTAGLLALGLSIAAARALVRRRDCSDQTGLVTGEAPVTD